MGFRYTVCQLATGYAVVGTVRNVGDGSVECIVEGTRAEIRAFLADVLAEMARYIHNHSCQWAPAGGQFDTFHIVH